MVKPDILFGWPSLVRVNVFRFGSSKRTMPSLDSTVLSSNQRLQRVCWNRGPSRITALCAVSTQVGRVSQVPWPTTSTSNSFTQLRSVSLCFMVCAKRCKPKLPYRLLRLFSCKKPAICAGKHLREASVGSPIGNTAGRCWRLLLWHPGWHCRTLGCHDSEGKGHSIGPLSPAPYRDRVVVDIG